MLDVRKHNFIQGINADDDEKLLSEGECLNLLNARVGISESGKDLRIENVLSNIERSNPYLPAGNNHTIGSAVDTAKRRLLFFNWNSNAEDGVYCYDIPSSTFYKVLVNSNLIPDGNQLTTNVIIAGGGISGISAAVEYFGYLKEGDILTIFVGKDTGSSIIDSFATTITIGYYETFVTALQRLCNLFNNNAIAITYGLHASLGSTSSAENAILINFNGSNWICQSDLTLSDFDNKPLNFSKDFRIDRNAKVIGDLLYWCEGDQNQPRKVNIEAGIKTNHPTYVTDARPYSLPIDYKWIHWIKRPPIYPLTWVKKTKPTDSFTALTSIGFLTTLNGEPWNGVVLYNAMTSYLTLDVGDRIEFTGTTSNNKIFTIVSISGNYIELLETVIVESGFFTARQVDVPASNAIADEVFYFGYYYEFWDNEVSAVSMLSEVCEMNTIFESSNNIGDFVNNETYNSIVLSIPNTEKIAPEIKSVVFLYKLGDTGGLTSFYRLDKTNPIHLKYINNHNNLSNGFDVVFYNNVNGNVLDSIMSANHQDIVPIKCKSFDISKNKIFSGNNLFGLNSPSQTSLNGSVNYTNITNDKLVHKHIGFASKYDIGIVFYDEFLRSCGVVYGNNIVAKERKIAPFSLSPSPTSGQIPESIAWNLNNANALLEIPNEAYYYSILSTKNQNYSTFFSNYCWKSPTISTEHLYFYVHKNNDGTYDYTNKDTYELNGVKAYAIGIAINKLNIGGAIGADNAYGYKKNYTYTEGDTAYVWLMNTYSGQEFEGTGLKVLGIFDSYIFLESKNIGDPSTNATITPYFFYLTVYNSQKKDLLNQYYECGKIFKVNNPTTNSRQYSTTSGTIKGGYFSFFGADKSVLFVYNRFNFVIDDYSNNKNKTFSTALNHGFVNIVDTIGQKRLKDTIAFSDTFIPGSKVNGLNKWQPLNRKEVGLENGEIQKLQLTNKQQEDGKIMLVITNNTVFSMYLGETQLVGSSKNANVAISDSVIGTINALKLNSGTIDPSTVIEINGEVYFFDRLNGKWVQYSTNGLFAISSYKMQRFFKEYAKAYNAAGKSAINTLNGFYHLTGCYDPYHNEIMLMMPALINASSAPLLPSYNSTTPSYATDIIKRENVFDKLAKTIVFNNEKNRHTSTYEYAVEWAENIDGKLFKFKDGKLFEHNVSNNGFNTFFGTQKPIRIVLSAGGNASEVKNIFDIAIEGNKSPDFTYVHTLYPDEQITDLIGDDYTEIEGMYYASFKKDRLSPNVIGNAVQKMLEGDIIKGIAPIIYLEFKQYGSLCYINFVNIGFERSLGHKNILK